MSVHSDAAFAGCRQLPGRRAARAGAGVTRIVIDDTQPLANAAINASNGTAIRPNMPNPGTV